MARKYQKYGIVVEYDNGERQTVNLAGVNTNDFERIKKAYHRVKNTYADKAKVIDFVGINFDGSVGTIYTKEIKKEVSRPELKIDVTQIMDNISKQLELIKEKQNYHAEMVGALDKKEDIFLHEFDDLGKRTFKNKEERDKAKLDMNDRIEEVRLDRRWHKEQCQSINRLLNGRINNGYINIVHLANIFRADNYVHEKKPLNMKLAQELNLYAEIPITDKEKQIAILQKTYEKIVVDPVSNKLICYNKAKQGGQQYKEVHNTYN